MRVEMLTQISGLRDGQEWPRPSETIEVPAHEGSDLILAGYAKEATDAPTPEPAPVPVVEEDGDEPAPTSDGDVPADAEPVAPVKPKARKAVARKG